MAELAEEFPIVEIESDDDIRIRSRYAILVLRYDRGLANASMQSVEYIVLLHWDNIEILYYITVLPCIARFMIKVYVL